MEPRCGDNVASLAAVCGRVVGYRGRRSRLIHVVIQPCEIRRGLWSAPRWPSCFRLWQGGALPLASRGAERRLAPPAVCTPWRGVRAPLAKGRCANRRSTRRWTASGGALPFDGGGSCIPAVSPRRVSGSELNHVGSFCPRADPRAARAPCLQGTKAQAPHPAPPWMPPEAPSSERGCRNIYVGT